jgi:hypothetical protein
MNLCNIHTHTNAEHKGPGFSIFAGDGTFGGYRCSETVGLTGEELADPWEGQGPFGNVKPGDTIEVHWVYTSCDVTPGEGLGSCLSPACSNPELRVEAQAFLLVNDPDALDFQDFDYAGAPVKGVHQPKALPSRTGEPVVFAGSTTGPSYSQEKCSPLQVTWSVRPHCARLDINSLHAWAQSNNVFKEVESHGVRPLVTAPELLSQIPDSAQQAAPPPTRARGSAPPKAPGTFGAPYPTIRSRSTWRARIAFGRGVGSRGLLSSLARASAVGTYLAETGTGSDVRFRTSPWIPENLAAAAAVRTRGRHRRNSGRSLRRTPGVGPGS